MKSIGWIAGILGLALMYAAPASAQMDDASAQWRASQVSVAVTATLVAPVTPSRRSITVTTTGATQVTCGPDNTVTAANGQPIAPVAFSSISLSTTAAVWCIAASAQTVAVSETF
jgi:hypothetical protein